MKHDRLRQEVRRSLVMVLAYTICCVAFISMYAVDCLREISVGNKAHALSFVPAKRISNDFEREILNARIFFIYFVTIQKPESLEKGWARYRNAESRLKDMAVLVAQYDELANLRPGVTKLQQDVADYGVALTATLNMVQSGETKGAHYDAQVKEWAARGAVMVGDAGALENLTSRSSEANTNDTESALRSGQKTISIMLAVSILLCVVLTVHRIHALELLLKSNLDAPQSSSPGTHSGAHIIEGGRIIPAGQV